MRDEDTGGDTAALAGRLRAARRAAGLTQTALAGEELSPSYVSLLEAGKREPSEAALAVLAARLGTTVAHLRDGEDGAEETRVRLEVSRARLALRDGDPQAALDRLGRVDLDAVGPGVRRQALATLAAAHEAVDDVAHAVQVLEPLLESARSQGRPLEAARLAATLSAVYLRAGDTYRSVDVGERALLDLEDASLAGGDEHLRLVATVVEAYVERGDVAYATHRVTQLVRVVEDQECPRGRGRVYEVAAAVAEERGDLTAASAYLQRALQVLQEGELNADLAALRTTHARLLLRSDPPDPRAALDQVERVWPVLAARSEQSALAALDVDRSTACLLLLDAAAAARWAASALARLDGERHVGVAAAHLALGDALRASGDGPGATRAYDAAAEVLAALPPSRRTAAAWREVGDRYRRDGDAAATIRAWDRALGDAGFRRSVVPPGVPRARTR
ncbi:helix-turn-helix domain-containing protein [Cellulomonas marina]|uniref:Helix-turn-helix domain-containing protein n=1 Tax=Cellulomonas marina TaxID=988821 RepID=A0A1I0YRK4_9CELL|nr:helix-turn-helix domain-containing protein [Cellulomonas marina]SFB15944.1 Helix-turn-helix domain-containing protein [Cellulomonas marina]